MNTPLINSDERLDEVNFGLKIIQKKSGLTFGTDALLLAGYIKGSSKLRAVELGGGTGIISLLLATRNKVSDITVFEIQEEYAELCRKNVSLNRMDEKISTLCKDIRDISLSDTNGKAVDVVFTNPPYMTSLGGKQNREDKKNIARHEVFGGIDDFCFAASRLLRYGGAFYAVYIPERLSDLISAMKKNSIEPKRLTFICHDNTKAPSLFLCEGKKCGKSGLHITKNLVIKQDGIESADYSYIMKNGEFDDSFKSKR